MNFIKTLLCAAVLAVVAIPNVNAQFSVRAGVAYGTDISEIGIQGGAMYQFNDQWRGSADLLFYLVGDGVSAYEINPNVHYIFSDTGTAQFYAIGGLNIITVSVDTGIFGNVSASDTGFNLGAGGIFDFGGVQGQAEAKYELAGGDQLVISAGLVFPIGGN